MTARAIAAEERICIDGGADSGEIQESHCRSHLDENAVRGGQQERGHLTSLTRRIKPRFLHARAHWRASVTFMFGAETPRQSRATKGRWRYFKLVRQRGAAPDTRGDRLWAEEVRDQRCDKLRTSKEVMLLG